MDNEQINAFLIYLNGKSNPVPPAIIYYEITEPSFDCNIAGSELLRLDLIEMFKDSFSIKHNTRVKMQSLPKEFENNPYGYFLDQEQKEKDRESQVKWWLGENAKQQFEDYPNVVKQRNLAIGIAIISIVVTIVLEVLKKKCT